MMEISMLYLFSRQFCDGTQNTPLANGKWGKGGYILDFLKNNVLLTAIFALVVAFFAALGVNFILESFVFDEGFQLRRALPTAAPSGVVAAVLAGVLTAKKNKEKKNK
jgi:hypothetical protein